MILSTFSSSSHDIQLGRLLGYGNGQNGSDQGTSWNATVQTLISCALALAGSCIAIVHDLEGAYCHMQLCSNSSIVAQEIVWSACTSSVVKYHHPLTQKKVFLGFCCQKHLVLKHYFFHFIPFCEPAAVFCKSSCVMSNIYLRFNILKQNYAHYVCLPCMYHEEHLQA